MYKKRNGFTLVELLAVVAILGVILAVSGGLIMNSLNGAKKNISDVEQNMLINTAELYYRDNSVYTYINDYNEKVKLSEYDICIQENLVGEGYLDEFEDEDGNTINGYIHVTTKNNKLTFSYERIAYEEYNCVPCSKGDVNQDGVINDADGDIILQYISSWHDIIEKYGATIEATGDANRDGDIDMSDSNYIYRGNALHKKPCTVFHAKNYNNFY